MLTKRFRKGKDRRSSQLSRTNTQFQLVGCVQDTGTQDKESIYRYGVFPPRLTRALTIQNLFNCVLPTDFTVRFVNMGMQTCKMDCFLPRT